MSTATASGSGTRLCVYTRSWRSAGAGLFAQGLVDGLVAVGAQVTFVCPPVEDARFEQPRDRLARIRPPRELVGRGSRVRRALVSLARIAGGVAGLAHARLRTRDFVVTIPDPLAIAVPVLALLRLSGARIYFVAHDPLPHAWMLPPALRRLEKATHGACYRLATAVVVLSEPSRVALKAAFPRLRRPVAVIDHGVFVMGEPTPLPGTGQLLAFGTIRRNKGMLEAIEGVASAAAAGAPVSLVVAGAPHRDDRAYAEQCAAAAAASPAIDLRLGYVEDEALRGLFATSDALLMPYVDFHSQSGVAILAASNARPVIATPAGGIATLIAEGMPAEPVAQPVSAETVSAAVTGFLKTPATDWTRRALAYRDHMIEHRSWPAIAARYVALIGGASCDEGDPSPAGIGAGLPGPS
jgi:glycogen(starch) synthase